jgi:hypothetical protein
MDQERPTTEEEVCGETYDHDWRAGDLECRRCGADLSHWNEDDPPQS